MELLIWYVYNGLMWTWSNKNRNPHAHEKRKEGINIISKFRPNSTTCLPRATEWHKVCTINKRVYFGGYSLLWKIVVAYFKAESFISAVQHATIPTKAYCLIFPDSLTYYSTRTEVLVDLSFEWKRFATCRTLVWNTILGVQKSINSGGSEIH